MEHPPASSAIADHAAIITELRSLLDDANADIARRHLDMNKAMGRVYAAEARIEDRDATIANLRSQLEALNTVSSAVNDGMAILIKDREATIAKLNEHKAGLIRCFEDAVNENADLRAEVEAANKALAEARKDRASIVAFLAAEAKRLRGDGQSPAAWKGGPDATVRLEDERIVIAFPSPDGKWQHAYSHTAEEAATLHTRLSAALRQRTDALGVDDAAPAKPSADELLRSIIDELLRKIDRMPCTAHDFLGTALYTKAAQAVGAPWVEEVDQ